jgi:hypothetical protein
MFKRKKQEPQEITILESTRYISEGKYITQYKREIKDDYVNNKVYIDGIAHTVIGRTHSYRELPFPEGMQLIRDNFVEIKQICCCCCCCHEQK